MRAWAKTFLQDETGQEMVEYALVIGVIALGLVAALNGLAASIAIGIGSIGSKVVNSSS